MLVYAGTSLPNVASWPVEIWERVFCLLKPGWLYIGTDCESRVTFSQSEKVLELRWFNDLKIVCSKFRDILSNNPEVPSTLALCKSAIEPDPGALLKWLGTNKHPDCLTVYTKGALELVLHPLFSLWFSQLQSVVFACATCTSLSSLSLFTAITTCVLHEPGEPALDLQCLARLSSLEHLVLQAGCFSELHLPTSLTALEVYEANVVCAPISTNALKNLTVADESELILHSKGVATCTALTRLQLSCGGAITADNPEDGLAADSLSPSVISTLCQLVHLTVSASTAKFDIGNFALVPNVRRLHLLLDGASLITGTLKTLTELRVSAFPDWEKPSTDFLFRPAVTIGVTLGYMHRLKSLVVVGPTVFNHALLQLTSLSSLQRVCLRDFRPGNQKTMQCLAEVERHCRHQHIEFCVEEIDSLPVGVLDADPVDPA